MNYRILPESIDTKYGPLYRIQATEDFLNVKEGDLGGLISGNAFLSPESECWIEKGSFLLGESSVTGNVLIQNQSVIDSCRINCASANITSSNLVGCVVRGSAKIDKSLLHGCIVSGSHSYISKSVLDFVSLGVQAMPHGNYTLIGANAVSSVCFHDDVNIQSKNELLITLYNDIEYLIYPLADNKVHIFNCKGNQVTGMKELRAKVRKVASAVSARLKGEK